MHCVTPPVGCGGVTSHSFALRTKNCVIMTGASCWWSHYCLSLKFFKLFQHLRFSKALWQSLWNILTGLVLLIASSNNVLKIFTLAHHRWTSGCVGLHRFQWINSLSSWLQYCCSLVFGGKDKARGFLILQTVLVRSHYVTMTNMILPGTPETGNKSFWIQNI